MDKSVEQYMAKQKSPQKEICLKLRKIIFRTFPDTKEEMKWGVPAFEGGLYYIVALKDHVNMGFSTKNLSKDELSLFDGGGETTKHIEIASIQNIDVDQIDSLLRLVKEKQK